MCRNLRKVTVSKEIKNFALQTGLKRAVDINQFKSLPTIDPAAHRGGVDPETASNLSAWGGNPCRSGRESKTDKSDKLAKLTKN